MSTVTLEAPGDLVRLRSTRPVALVAFGSLLLRDLRVMWKQVWMFLARAITQPLLMVFVFAYVFPKIGQGIGGNQNSESSFSTLLAPGLMAVAVIFQGIQAVALPLVTEFGYTREIEDRVMAPLPVWGVAVAKIVSGAIQALMALFIVLPLVVLVPASPVHFHLHILEIMTIVPIGCLVAGSLGLAIGTSFEPRSVSLIFSIIVIPMMMLGCAYYPWSRLEAIKWLKYAVLFNPLVYMCEGFRGAFTTVPHMSYWGVYAGLIVVLASLSTLGIRNFYRRVLV
jgi:ABC-2 type transport system permease protein